MSDEHRQNFLTCPAVPELPPAGGFSDTSKQPQDQADIDPLSTDAQVLQVPKESFVPPPPIIPPSAAPQKAPHPLRPFVLAVCGILIGIALILFSVVIYGAVYLGGAVSELRSSAQAIRLDVDRRDFIAAEDELPRFLAALDHLSEGVARLRPIREWPFVGRDIRTLEHVMDIAQALSEGVEQTVKAAASFEQVLESVGLVERGLDGSVISGREFGSLSPTEKEEILSRFAGLLPELRQAREKVKLAASLWTDLPAEARSSSIMAPIAAYGARLPELTKRADQLISFLDLLLPLVGHPSENRYLIVLQNSDEMRPTGGFLGTIGYLRVKSADIKEMRFDDVYAIDNPVSGVWKEEPPAPLKKYLAATTWFFRDRNWSPDFPTSAEDMMRTYLAERALAATGTTDYLDGVIAFTPEFFEDILRFTGPVSVDGKTFTAENFFDQLQYDTEQGFLTQGIPVERRKEIVLRLGDALVRRLMTQSTDRLPTLLDLLTDNLTKKNVLFYLRDPRTRSLLDARGWTGRVAGTSSDYLWVVDANLAALKTDGMMEKRAKYSVDLTTGLATLTLRYHNTVRRIDWRHTRYRDYVRVYVPEGSELMSVSGAWRPDGTPTTGSLEPGAVDVTRELGKTVFGAFWIIEPQETRDLRFTYRLPPTVLEAIRATQGYDLTVQRQPGNDLELTLDHALGKNVRAADPPEAANEFGDQRYRVSLPLDRDRAFRVRF
ncbi:DUF4012 domain-containing protein [Patescibacteria group bacterium]|nr:DUF4012 domain-containing protein [Patescibacteria group bacterium]